MIDRSQHRRGEAGFTLVELMVVMLIIGVLATLAVPSFLGLRTRSFDAGAKSDVRNMTKMHATLESNGVYATTIDQLLGVGFEPTAKVQHGICADRDFGVAVAAKHQSSDAIWMIDYQGRLSQSGLATVEQALNGLLECRSGANEPDVRG